MRTVATSWGGESPPYIIKNLSADKPDSVVPVKPEWPSFILPQHYCYDLAAYPPTLHRRKPKH